MNKTILIAEDEQRLSHLLSQQFEERGFTVYVAGDGQEAIDLVKEQGEAIDCILMDILMPRVDGVDAIKSIQKLYDEREEKYPHIIALTNLDDPETVRRVLMLNVPSYIVKADVDMKQIISQVEGELFLI